ncbi:hypothetical protein MNBD_GAMMA01-1310 [hydrothermal vent metagenome]|uniref:Uncharacterized protein n=1 Tax=hydrothermal vent metagenome TaxID=652676 RepID=A0A3B0V5S0_9ZZZZ
MDILFDPSIPFEVEQLPLDMHGVFIDIRGGIYTATIIDDCPDDAPTVSAFEFDSIECYYACLNKWFTLDNTSYPFLVDAIKASQHEDIIFDKIREEYCKQIEKRER